MRRVLAVLLAALIGVAGCTEAPRPAPPAPPASDRGDLAAEPESIARSTGPFAAGPVAPPARGAFLGAWVKPDALTQPRRVAAVEGWEASLGRPLNVVHTYKRLDEPFFTASDTAFAARATLMLSWAGGDSRSVVQGRHDALLRDRARRVREFGQPLLMRYRWEMDRPNLAASVWSSADYIAAWRHVRAVFAAEGARNVSWVWCPTVEGFERGDAASYYPGDADVDWVCVDVYAGSRFRPLADLLRPFLQWTAAHPSKPVMIGEFGVARAWAPEQRASWLRNAGAVFKANPQIKAVLYYESDPDGNERTGHFSLLDDPPAMAAFTAMAREPYFNP